MRKKSVSRREVLKTAGATIASDVGANLALAGEQGKPAADPGKGRAGRPRGAHQGGRVTVVS